MREANRRFILGLGVASAALPFKAGRTAGPSLIIRIEFSTNRDQTGTLRLVDSAGRPLAGPFPAYGRADNTAARNHGNPKREPTLPFGDTPIGTYSIPRAVATGTGTRYVDRSYGPNGALVMKPETGDARVAAGKGRVGLLIHSGAPGAGGKLRATNGCVRLSNADMLQLMQAIAGAGENPAFNRCEVTRIDASVGPPGDPVAGEEAGDPPPDIQSLLSPGSIILPGPIPLPRP